MRATTVLGVAHGPHWPSSWPIFWTVAGVLLVVMLTPLAIYQYPGFVDYPNHLARLHILVGQLPDGWRDYYSVRHVLIPNLALDLICPLFVGLGLDPNAALRLFVALTMIGFAGGTIAVGTAATGSPPWFALVAFPIAYNRYLVLGLLNYLFSVGLALLLLAAWLHSRRLDAKWYRTAWLLLLSLGALVLLTSHLAGYGLFLVAVFGYELGVFVGTDVAWRKKLRNPLSLALAVAPSALIYFFVFDHSSGFSVSYGPLLYNKVTGALSPFFSYTPGYAVATITVFVFCGWAVWRFRDAHGKLGWPLPAALTLMVLVLAFLVLPTGIMGHDQLDKRLSIFVLALGLGLLVVPYTPRLAAVLVFCSFLLMAIKTAEIGVAWEKSTQSFAAIRSATQTLPLKASLISFSFGSNVLAAFPPVRHAGAFAVIERAAFIPSLFAYPIYSMSVAYKEIPAAMTSLARGGSWGDPNDVDWKNYCDAYDFILVTFQYPLRSWPPCMTEYVAGAGFTIFKTTRRKQTQ